MPNAKTRQKLADRFKTLIFSRIKQSPRARKKNWRMEEKEQEARDTKQELQGTTHSRHSKRANGGSWSGLRHGTTSTESTTIIWNTWMQQFPPRPRRPQPRVVWRVWSSDPRPSVLLTTSRLSGNGFVGANMPPREFKFPRVEAGGTAEEKALPRERDLQPAVRDGADSGLPERSKGGRS